MGLSPAVVLTLISIGCLAMCLAYGLVRVRRVRLFSWDAAWLLSALCCCVLWRWPHGGEFFHGLEYEDAYLYTVVARQALFQPFGDTYLTTVCAVGSLVHCSVAETYSGHFIGYPYLLADVARIFGYSPFIANYAAVVAAALSTILVYSITKRITGDRTGPIVAAAVFAWVPVFSVHGVASFAEPVSSLLVGASLYFFLAYAYDPSSSKFARTSALLAFAFVTALAVSVKRENMLLPIVSPCVAVLLKRAAPQRTAPRGLGWIVLASILVILYGTSELHVSTSVASEVVEYRGFPFRLTGLLSMLPAFVASFLRFKWFLGTWILVAAGTVLAMRERHLALHLVGLLVAYLALYMTHVRSYYQLHASDVAPMDSLRYSMNLMVVWSVLAGFGAARLIARARMYAANRRLNKIPAVAALCGVLAASTSYLVTRALRTELVADEYYTRVEPAVAAARLAKELHAQVLTMEPLLIQMYGDDGVNVLDLTSVNRDLLASITEGELLYVKHAAYSTGTNLDRYDDELQAINELSWRLVHRGSEFSIYRRRRAASSNRTAN
jgi:Dolichyl-phosphate-mannose-protein mannosyltransferase